MNHSTPAPLPRLVSLLGSSLAMYLADAGIWTYPGSEEIKLALADLADDHRSLLERAGTILEERGDEVPGRQYPIQFTATHDVDVRTLLPRIVAGLGEQVVALDALAGRPDPAADVVASDLVREAAASSRAHADVLRQLLARPRAVAG